MKEKEHHLFLRNGIWWYDILSMHPHHPKQRIRNRGSCHTRTFEVAAVYRDRLLGCEFANLTGERLIQRLQSIKNDHNLLLGEQDPLKEKIKTKIQGTCEQWFNLFISERGTIKKTSVSAIRSYRNSYNALKIFLSRRKIADLNINNNEACEFRDLLIRTPKHGYYDTNLLGSLEEGDPLALSLKTVGNILANLRSYFEWLRKKEYHLRNPWINVDMPQFEAEEKVIFSPEEIDLLCNLPCPKTMDLLEWQVALLLLRYTGGRNGVHEAHATLKIPHILTKSS
jgi:hypothetical protein